MKRVVEIAVVVVIIGLLVALMMPGVQTGPFCRGGTILATTFPVYQITRNIVGDCPGVRVELMLPPQTGCPHSYTLTPADMRKLGQCRILVVNGLDLEPFLDEAMQMQEEAKLLMVDSSRGIDDLIVTSGDNTSHANHAETETGHVHGPECVHLHGDADGESVNPHLFASPRMVALLTRNIAEQLADADPPHADVYRKNAAAYAEKMDQLAGEVTEVGSQLNNRRIVTQHGVFDYLARDMRLEIVAVVQSQAGHQPSAAEMLELVKTVREKQAGAIFTEPQYPADVAKTIASETGITTAVLDPIATGPDDAPLDYFEVTMRHNLDVLKQTLGAK